MANRAKKDASEALLQLRTYLRSHPHGYRLLEAVSRYQGELRQRCSQLLAAAELSEKGARAATSRHAALAGTIEKLRRDLEKERALTSQLRFSMANMQSHIDELEKELEPPDLEIPTDVPEKLQQDIPAVKRLVKSIRSRMKTAPLPYQSTNNKQDQIRLVNLKSVLTDYTDNEYTTLGMWATLSAILGMPVSFCWPYQDDEKRIGQLMTDVEYESLVGKYVRWMRNWIRPTETDDKLYYLGIPKPKGGRGARLRMIGMAPGSVVLEDVRRE